jgi:acyl dehydratase
MTPLYYEDYEEGAIHSFGPRELTRAEIVAYAAEFDPQPFHLDEEAAKDSLLGGLAASGWHTCCLMFRMAYDGIVSKSASLGSPGVEETRWLKPVRPDVPFTLRFTVLDKRVSKSRPEIGLVRIRFDLVDDRGTLLAVQTSTLLLARHAAQAEPAR